MYTYKVYNFDYDDTNYFVLQHETKFSKEEYEHIVNDCRKKVNAKINRNIEIIESNEDITEALAEELELYTCSGEWHRLSNIKNMMIVEYGFKEINIEFTFVLNDGFYGRGIEEKNKVID